MTKTIIIGGQPASYRESGEGPAVFLLHGFGEDHRFWDRALDALTGYRLIAPDLPGTGETPLLPDTSMESLAAWTGDLMDALSIDKATVIGHSMGGYIALAVVEAFGNRLLGLGLFHSSALADNEEKKVTRRKGIDFIRENGGEKFLATATPNLFAPRSKSEHPEWIGEAMSWGRSLRGESLIAYYEAMMSRPDRTDLLREIEVPVLFVLGRHDAAVPFDDGMKQVPLAKTTQVTILDDSGHMGLLEEEKKSIGALRSFLELVNTGNTGES